MLPFTPEHNTTLGPFLGLGFTVTFTMSKLVQPNKSVAVSVKAVVVAGFTVGFSVFPFLRILAAGVHV